MEIKPNTCWLLASLEYLIGSECYNPNSRRGYSIVYESSIRYPVTITDDNGFEWKERGNYSWDIEMAAHDPSVEEIKSMKYKFGANELYIGNGLIKALEFLENRYGLDFNELERSIEEHKR